MNIMISYFYMIGFFASNIYLLSKFLKQPKNGHSRFDDVLSSIIISIFWPVSLVLGFYIYTFLKKFEFNPRKHEKNKFRKH